MGVIGEYVRHLGLKEFNRILATDQPYLRLKSVRFNAYEVRKGSALEPKKNEFGEPYGVWNRGLALVKSVETDEYDRLFVNLNCGGSLNHARHGRQPRVFQCDFLGHLLAVDLNPENIDFSDLDHIVSGYINFAELELESIVMEEHSAAFATFA